MSKSCRKVVRKLPKSRDSAQIRPTQAVFGHKLADLGQIDKRPARFCRCGPNPAKCPPTLTKLGRTLGQSFFEMWPNRATHRLTWSKLVETQIDQNVVRNGQCSPGVVKVGPNQPTCASDRPSWAEFGPILGSKSKCSTTFGQRQLLDNFRARRDRRGVICRDMCREKWFEHIRVTYYLSAKNGLSGEAVIITQSRRAAEGRAGGC